MKLFLALLFAGIAWAILTQVAVVPVGLVFAGMVLSAGIGATIA